MTRFQKMQKISGIVPFFSTFFVAYVTMFELKRNAASGKIWLHFILTLLLAGFLLFLLNAVPTFEQYTVLKIIVMWIALAMVNIRLVDLQVMSKQVQQLKKKSAYTKVIIICCLALVIVNITGLLLVSWLFFPSDRIEDINGAENTNLSMIDAAEIISSPDYYSASSIYTSHKGSQTNVARELQEYDYQECSFSCKKISGIITLQATKTSSERLTLEVSSQLEEGNLEIVILVDGEYYSNVPINENSTIVLSDIAEKTVLIRIAAEDAKVSVAAKRLEG